MLIQKCLATCGASLAVVLLVFSTVEAQPVGITPLPGFTCLGRAAIGGRPEMIVRLPTLQVTAAADDPFSVTLNWTGRIGADYTVREVGGTYRATGHVAPIVPRPGSPAAGTSTDSLTTRKVMATHEGALPGSLHNYEITEKLPDGTLACGTAIATTPAPPPISVTGEYIDGHDVTITFEEPSSAFTARLSRPLHPVVEDAGPDKSIIYDIGRPGHWAFDVRATGRNVLLTVDPGPPPFPYSGGQYSRARITYPFTLEVVWTENPDGSGRTYSMRQPFQIDGPVPVIGYADVHAHMFAYFGFGGNPTSYPLGKHFWGKAYGQIADALPWCTPQHGPGGTGDLVEYAMQWNLHHTPANTGHAVGGYPKFDGWPRWDSFTHQQYHEDWLKRAHEKGLKLIVTHPVNNEWMCTTANHVSTAELSIDLASIAAAAALALPAALTLGVAPFFTIPNIAYWQNHTDAECLDKDAAEYQIQEAYNMQNDIDIRVGDGAGHTGPGTGWFRIVKTPKEARDVIAAGKLAVVIGMEVDHPFECTVNSVDCNAEYVVNQVRRYHDLGVRHFFPIHFYDNAFGGSADSNALIQMGFGGTLDKRTCDDEGYQSDLIKGSDGYLHPQCNKKGLTDLGKLLVHELINWGMVIDVDHMSALTFNDALSIAVDEKYPVVSGHTGFTEIATLGENNEGNRTPSQISRIVGVGGMFAVIPHQTDDVSEIKHFPPSASHKDIPHNCGNSSETVVQAYRYITAHNGGGPVGFGTDLNGFAGWPSPRFGPDACSGGGSSSLRRLVYPATIAASGVSINVDQSVIGERPPFDFNTDGFAHIGMLPDMIADFEAMGMSPDEIDPLFLSAEGYIRLWERTDYRRYGMYADP
jgi:microsomal dipeptidase-like Zn-dependent dipeptidase